MPIKTAERSSDGRTRATEPVIRRFSTVSGRIMIRGTRIIALMRRRIYTRLEVSESRFEPLGVVLTGTDPLPESCSAFRSLQGWLSMSHTGTGEGTLRLVPELKLSTAYQLLRPYFILNEQFDDVTPLFPGATPGSLQFLPTDELHPHLFMEKSMVGIPPVKPGDYVFWHCDLVHEVDKFHPGERDSSVSYNGCVPLCPYNIENMASMRQSFLDVLPPKDFEKYEHGELEREHEDHGAKRENILSLEGLRAMGLEPFDVNEEGLTPGQREVRKMANARLGFVDA